MNVGEDSSQSCVPIGKLHIFVKLVRKERQDTNRDVAELIIQLMKHDPCLKYILDIDLMYAGARYPTLTGTVGVQC